MDYHHGNGTQDIFYSRADVFYVSLHGDPSRAYPYFSGSTSETGEGDGIGYTLNIPLPAACNDATYTAALQQALLRVAHFAPHFVVVSLGIDTFMGDPLGDFCITRAGYSSIGEIIGALKVPTMYLPNTLFPTRHRPSHDTRCASHATRHTSLDPLFHVCRCDPHQRSIRGADAAPRRYVMEGGYVVAELGNNVAAVLLGHESAAGV